MLRGSTAVLFGLIVLAGHAAGAQPPTRVGVEFQVNAFTPNNQLNTAIGQDAAGNFVVVWTDESRDGNSAGIFGRRFNSAGLAQAVEFQVNAYTASYQGLPALDMNAAGAFVVSWSSQGQDGSYYGIFARRFNSAGVAQATELQVNSYTSGAQAGSEVAIDGSGGFVVVFPGGRDSTSSDVFGRRFNSAGTAIGLEFQVNTVTELDQNYPDVDMDAAGDFVVAWHSLGSDPIGGVFGQRFTSAGTAEGPEFHANTYITNGQTLPEVAVDADGDFVVTWISFGQDGSSTGIFGRRFTKSGTPLGAEFQVNAYVTGVQYAHDVASDANGGFVVVWHGPAPSVSGYEIFARHFRGSGATQGPDLLVNTATAGDQIGPSVGFANGSFVVSWSASQTVGTDIHAQRFEVPAVLDIDGDGELGALTDGLLILRFFFGFTGTTLTAGAVGPGCSRCDVASILPYLEGLT